MLYPIKLAALLQRSCSGREKRFLRAKVGRFSLLFVHRVMLDRLVVLVVAYFLQAKKTGASYQVSPFDSLGRGSRPGLLTLR